MTSKIIFRLSRSYRLGALRISLADAVLLFILIPLFPPDSCLICLPFPFLHGPGDHLYNSRHQSIRDRSAGILAVLLKPTCAYPVLKSQRIPLCVATVICNAISAPSDLPGRDRTSPAFAGLATYSQRRKPAAKCSDARAVGDVWGGGEVMVSTSCPSGAVMRQNWPCP